MSDLVSKEKREEIADYLAQRLWERDHLGVTEMGWGWEDETEDTRSEYLKIAKALLKRILSLIFAEDQTVELLSDEGIRKAIKQAMDEGQEYGDDGKPLPEKLVAKAQHAKDQKRIEQVFEAVEFYDKNYSNTEWGNEHFRKDVLALKAKEVSNG